MENCLKQNHRAEEDKNASIQQKLHITKLGFSKSFWTQCIRFDYSNTSWMDIRLVWCVPVWWRQNFNERNLESKWYHIVKKVKYLENVFQFDDYTLIENSLWNLYRHDELLKKLFENISMRIRRSEHRYIQKLHLDFRR